MAENEKLQAAKLLLDDFAERTGITGNKENATIRYLWTDAFAVQAFFGLSRTLENEIYRNHALRLIELVHAHLGRFHPDDDRQGWISGLPEEEGQKHPTIGGLRIGKSLPERDEGQPIDHRLEWERDGQYFHYLTRWFTALLQAGQETGDSRYATWAAELMQGGGKFLSGKSSRPAMYWKMSTDLSRPLVPSMGAHDPLEGLICTKSALKVNQEKASELEPLAENFRIICKGIDWKTTDALGIGGLLLNTVRSAGLCTSEVDLPDSVRPERLFEDSLFSLKSFARDYRGNEPAGRRLAFRECGLSLGLRTLSGMRTELAMPFPNIEELDNYMYLAEEIENFWSQPRSQTVATWKDHLDINAVSLAASLVANEDPAAFSGMRYFG